MPPLWRSHPMAQKSCRDQGVCGLELSSCGMSKRGENIATFQQEKGGVTSVAFSPDGTKIAGAGSLWDVENKTKTRHISK